MYSEEEILLKGAPVSDGIAIGSPYFLLPPIEEKIPEFPIAIGEVDDEIARYRRALFSSREELQKLQYDLASANSTDAMGILDAHIQMLDDPLITVHMEEKIRQMRQNTESVFRSFISEYEENFTKTSDSFFQQRLIDVIDLSKRILGHLCFKNKPCFSDIPVNSVIFSKILIPSHTASMHTSHVIAFVTELGGGNSHTALIARAKGIPYVASIDVEFLRNTHSKFVIVDGGQGHVIVHPSAKTLKKYTQLMKRHRTKIEKLEKKVDFDPETMDGYLAEVHANIESASDIDLLHQYQGAGVGLFRSEYLFLQDEKLFSSEEEQYQVYKSLILKTKGLPIVMRVLDIGSDKNVDLFHLKEKEPNPILGCRGIRFLLKYPKIFKMQLRALLRASIHGDVRILLPLISDVHELREAKRIIEEIKQELERQHIQIKRDVPVGSMLEVPSAVMISDILAEESDFFAIGTNDLVQFTLGVDRSNPSMSDLCTPAHPSVIRMIKMCVLEAKRYHQSISVCGEIASNPIFIPLLLGLGINKFSCPPRYIPRIKRVIRNSALVECYRLAEKIFSLNTSSEILEALLENYRKIISEE